jgi:hypothetical protein
MKINILTYIEINHGTHSTHRDYNNRGEQIGFLLTKELESFTAYNLSKCNNTIGCPIWLRSEFSLKPTLSIIDNVSKSTGIQFLIK